MKARSALRHSLALLGTGNEALHGLLLTRLDPNPEVDNCMATTVDKLASEIQALPDIEKLRLVDAILTDLDKPDPEIDRVWAEEARKRWAAYKAGRISTVSYEDMMARYNRQ
jgi:putative addiction module component (TIGR02574 family)